MSGAGKGDPFLQITIHQLYSDQEVGLWVESGNSGLLSRIKEVSPEDNNQKEVHMETSPHPH